MLSRILGGLRTFVLRRFASTSLCSAAAKKMGLDKPYDVAYTLVSWQPGLGILLLEMDAGDSRIFPNPTFSDDLGLKCQWVCTSLLHSERRVSITRESTTCLPYPNG